MYWLVAAGLGYLAWGCQENKSVKPVQPMAPSKTPKKQEPVGEKYSVRVENNSHEIYHHDKNQDKIFQSDREELLLTDGDHFLAYGT